MADRFARVEPRCRVRDLALGLLSDLPRKNCWSIAEWAGEATPDGIQHLPGRARGDADAVREYVLDREDRNAQVAVYLVHTGLRGYAAVGRELYIPRSWTHDPDRCRAAGLDEDTVFATKSELAARMIGRYLGAGHRAGWVAADKVYGGNPKLRSALEEHQVGYVLAIACSHEVTTGAGKFRTDALAAKVPKRAWQKLPADAGAKGHCFYWGRHRPGRTPSRQPPAADPPQPHRR